MKKPSQREEEMALLSQQFYVGLITSIDALKNLYIIAKGPGKREISKQHSHLVRIKNKYLRKTNMNPHQISQFNDSLAGNVKIMAEFSELATMIPSHMAPLFTDEMSKACDRLIMKDLKQNNPKLLK